ncbi:MAG: ATP-binding cassette domain-containing protein [Ketobacteraceae bacterium]|nr:ATP-binding cassette domain-containing protein [Ketobacteraceae bacterium]
MPLLSLEKAVLGYQRPVIGPLSLTVDIGEKVGIWGPNGCGKSTLLNYFTGRSRLLSGTIHLSSDVRIAYQPQHPVRPHELPLTGREYLELMGADSSQAPGRVAPFLDKRTDRLSGGQFQILSTWANLASEGQLVLLDEPTNNLDPDAIALLTETILAMPPAHGLIVVSHEREFITSVANRIVELN